MKHHKSNSFGPPIEQPSGDVLSEVMHICMLWVRGEMYSTDALYNIREFINDTSEIVESGGSWSNDKTTDDLIRSLLEENKETEGEES